MTGGGERRGRGAAAVAARALVAGSLALLTAGCAGIFQRAMPAEPARYARTAVGPELRVGAAERDITPRVGDYLAGFDLARTSTAIASRLKVRALVLELGDRRFAIVGVDTLGMLRDDVDWVKAGLTGFANGDVFVCASHTHAGADLVGLWGWYLWTSGRTHDYLAEVRAAVTAAVAEARQRAAPAALVRGHARLPADGLVKNANFAGVFDRGVEVLHARALDDGRPLGTLLHVACHPEVMPRRNTQICADFVGVLCDEWRDAGLGQAVFANGALGAMVSPSVQPRGPEGVHKLGTALLALARAALADARPLPVDAIEVRRRDVYVPLASTGLKLGRLTMAIPRELYDGAARSTVGWLRIGAFEAVCVPGEMEPALAERVRARLGRPDLVVFGLCDDELGYLLRAQDADDPEFAYERSMSPCRLAGEIIEGALCGPASEGGV
ncbi:MAG: hypothetical protein AB7O97_06620 [Planctomycetota bacterium]